MPEKWINAVPHAWKKIKTRHALFNFTVSWVLLSVMLAAASEATAQTAKPTPEKFDHFSTGFPLLGAHTVAECESCHIRGVFKGTPKNCAGCHNNVVTVGKGQDHVPTNAPCDTCHNPRSTTFVIVGVFDHVDIRDGCNACHMDERPANHIPTPPGSECNLCHRVPPDTFASATLFDHANVTSMRCDACHNGAFVAFGSLGTTPDHPRISAGQDCHDCHNTTTFVGAGFDHTNVTSGCNACHLKDRPAAHIPTPAASECILCHQVSPDTFAAATLFNHTNVTSMRCDACHNGAFVAFGSIGTTPDHLPIPAGQDCKECHTTTTFAGGGFDHTNVITGCNTCHLKDRSVTHIPTPAASECILCHRVSPETFTQAALFNHGNVRSMRCDACHNGAFDASGSIGKTATHPPTQPGVDCHDCHSTTSFADPNFDHAGVTTGCLACHGDDLPAVHVPRPAGSECVLCHRVPPPDDFTMATAFNHSSVTTLRCDACHSGAFVADGALGKSLNHPPTQPNQDCNACHKNTTSFTNADFDHTGVTTGCNQCHASEVTATHIPRPAGSECILCHRVEPDTFATAALFNHDLVIAMRCDNCHSGQFNGAPGRSASHIPVPPASDCKTCHVARAAGGGWALPAAFDHNLVTAMRCDACHNGQFDAMGATGKGATHIPTPTGSDCNTCHVVRPVGGGWALASPFNHALVTSSACSTCHSGGFVASGAVGKGPTHISSTANCDRCHVTTDWTSTISPLDHTQVLGSCSSCHLSELPTTHMPRPAASDCGSCHTNPPPLWTQAAKFNHSLVTAMRCDACHNGSFATSGAIGKNAQHIPTAAGQDCASCHRAPPDSFALATTFNHNSVTTLRCTQCHSGQFAASGAAGKGPGHFVTTAECNRCHTIAPGWPSTVATFRHVSANYPGDHNAGVTCVSCHTTNNEVATWRNAALKPFCAGCHEGDYDAGEHDRTVTPPSQYSAAELKNCSGPCHTYSTTVGGAIAQTRNGPEHRVNDNGF